jgi:hypothetical protein
MKGANFEEPLYVIYVSLCYALLDGVFAWATQYQTRSVYFRPFSMTGNPLQGVLPTVCRNKKLKKRPRYNEEL